MLGAAVSLPGLVTLPLSAQAAESSRVVAEKDPTLLNKATAFADEVSYRGDQLDAAGSALTATGIGSLVGVPMMAAGGAISNGGSVASLALDTPNAIKRAQTDLEQRRNGGPKYTPRSKPDPTAVALNGFLKDPIQSVQNAIPEGLRIAQEYFGPLRRSIGITGQR